MFPPPGLSCEDGAARRLDWLLVLSAAGASLLACGELQAPDGGDGDGDDVEVAWTAVAAGGSHTCGLARSGTVHCWGSDGFGQLGVGAGLDANSTAGDECDEPCALRPVAVESPTSFDTVVAGRFHSCGLSPSGDAYCWGRNDRGQLGDSTVVDRPSPTPVAADLAFGSLSAGGSHTCGITRVERRLYCWGDNFWGQLGRGSRSDRAVRVPRFVLRRARFVEAGEEHTCAVSGSRRLLLCWGRNHHGQLGLGYVSRIPEPSPTPLLAPSRWVTAGRRHTCVTSGRDGTASCWGWNDEGALGTGGESGFEPDPRRVAGSGRFRVLSAGSGHTCGLDLDGRLACWGDNRTGQLGQGRFGGVRVVPSPVAPGRVFTAVSAGAGVEVDAPNSPPGDLDGVRAAAHTCAVDRDARMLCWGANESGQLGDGTLTHRSGPTPVSAPGR